MLATDKHREYFLYFISDIYCAILVFGDIRNGPTLKPDWDTYGSSFMGAEDLDTYQLKLKTWQAYYFSKIDRSNINHRYYVYPNLGPFQSCYEDSVAYKQLCQLFADICMLHADSEPIEKWSLGGRRSTSYVIATPLQFLFFKAYYPYVFRSEISGHHRYKELPALEQLMPTIEDLECAQQEKLSFRK